jgi:outer membrane protein
MTTSNKYGIMKQFLLAVAIVVGTTAMAQDNPIKDEQLKTLISKAVTNYPGIKELEEQLNAFGVRDEITKINYLPEISGDASYRYTYPTPAIDFNGSKFKFQPNNNYDGHVSISQLVYDFGKTKLQLERTKSEKDLTQSNIENSKNAVAYQVTQAYYGIRFLLKSINVQEDQLKVLKDNEQLIQSKIRNGDALEYDLLTTQVRTKNAENRLNDLKSQLEKQYIYLQLLTGEDQHAVKPTADNDAITIVSDISQTSWKNTNAQAIILQKQIELYKFDIKAASVNNRPAIVASGNTGIRNGFVPEIEKLMWNANAGVGISVPIFSGNKVKLQQKLSQINIATANKSLETIAANIQKDLSTVQADYKTLQQKLDNTNVLVQQAQKAFDLANVRFKAGLITNVELLGVQTNVEDAKLQQVQLEYQLQLDRLESYKVTGVKIY